MAQPFLDVARLLAQQAAARLMELRLKPLVENRKPDRSLVTNADHEADRIIREGLHRAFPDHQVLTEESGFGGAAQSEYIWIVDPLDGTKAYARGAAGFSVMIGLLHQGQPFAGVVLDPMEGYLYEAVRGQGAWITTLSGRTPARVSNRKEWPQMPVITSTGFPASLQTELQRTFSGPWLPALNSVGVKVGYVVSRRADIYVNHHRVHYWDTCAPHVILAEAGGVLTYLDGTPLTYSLAGEPVHALPTLATNGTRHAEALKIVQASRMR